MLTNSISIQRDVYMLQSSLAVELPLNSFIHGRERRSARVIWAKLGTNQLVHTSYTPKRIILGKIGNQPAELMVPPVVRPTPICPAPASKNKINRKMLKIGTTVAHTNGSSGRKLIYGCTLITSELISLATQTFSVAHRCIYSASCICMHSVFIESCR